jgi:hypothetical protein
MAPGSPQPVPLSPPAVKPTSPWDNLKDKSTAWFKERMTDLPDDLAKALDRMGDGALGDSVRDAVHSLARGGAEDDGMPFDLQETVRDLAGKLPNLGDYMPSEPVAWPGFRSLFQDLHAPSLSFDPPAVSLGTPSGSSGDGFGMDWLWLVVLALFGFILYRSAQRRQSGIGDPAGWHLGPWPVAPGAVRTRHDLVVAFEYLAFLCLGPSARTCNHLDVADRLREKAPVPDAESRHAAADQLARLYEQARYAPDNELLTDGDLATARRDLCLLAGVANA